VIEVAGKAVVDAVTSVVVVGGGPCGLITALLLGRLGVSTVLFEKHSGISRHPKAMAVTRRTAEIYRQLGLLEAMQTGGLRLPADHVSVWLRGGLAGELLGVAPFAPEDERFSPCHPFHCPQPHTEAVLLAAVRAEPMVDCRFGTTVTRVTQDGTLVQVDFRGADGASGCLEVLSVSPWVMTPSLATRWRQGRCLLVGDAAARVSPSGGLGMNNGVQGAHNLAWKLAAVVHGQVPEELLDSYEQERLAASEFTFANSEGNAEEIFAIVGAALAGDWEQASQRIARSRRAGAGYGQDFGIVYGSHAVQPDGSEELKPLDVVNDDIPQARPGHRAPHAWITRGAGRVSTLDCFGGGFVALAAAGADRELLQTWAPGVEVLVEGRDFQDPAGEWRRLYGLGETGAVLVRPDGYVAARR
jgi:hypothetical protein